MEVVIIAEVTATNKRGLDSTVYDLEYGYESDFYKAKELVVEARGHVFTQFTRVYPDLEVSKIKIINISTWQYVVKKDTQNKKQT